MRGRSASWSLGALLLLAGCPLPEDGFVLSGSVAGVGAGVEVRLLRNQLASDTRCDSLEPLATTLTGEGGRYTFELLRQQVTRGVPARRFFRVEVDSGPGVLSQTFWFPDADLALGELSAQGAPAAWRITETELDGYVAWRSELTGTLDTDRAFRWRQASTLREWRTVPIDSLGRYDIIPVEWRLEGPWAASLANAAIVPPRSRGGECPFLDVTPCPLTDGRFVPVVLPQGTRELIFNFHHEVSVNPLLFHGLVLERPAARARLDFNFVEDFGNWTRLASPTVDLRLQDLSVDRCNEPGAFLGVGLSTFIKPVVLRVVFEDEAGEAVPITSLAEVSAR